MVCVERVGSSTIRLRLLLDLGKRTRREQVESVYDGTIPEVQRAEDAEIRTAEQHSPSSARDQRFRHVEDIRAGVLSLFDGVDGTHQRFLLLRVWHDE